MKLIEFLSKTCEIPLPYGTFHLIFLSIFFGASIIGAIIFRKGKEKSLRIFIGVLWVVMVVMEIFKLIRNNFYIQDNTVVFGFAPNCLSYQFCSLPLYFLPVVVFAKEGKLRDTFSLFLGTYGLIAGLSVFIFPETVFDEFLFSNYQTMIHHGIQVLTGFVLLVRYYDKYNLRMFFRTFVLFYLTVLLAQFLNELLPAYFPECTSIDFFYISPKTIREFPIIGNLKQQILNCSFVLGYIGVFSFVSFLTYIIPSLISFNKKCFSIKKEC